MATEELFIENAYLQSCEAVITRIDDKGIFLNRTVFYPRGGGQVGDCGWIAIDQETRINIADTYREKSDGVVTNEIIHVPAEHQSDLLERLQVGMKVNMAIDWERRFRLMRFHTASHLLCALLPWPVNGCSISPDHARLDFVTSAPLSPDEFNVRLANFINSSIPVLSSHISAEELAANPYLIRTMSVKPPAGAGTLRLVNIEGVDLQPCGGTHVSNTAEVGNIHIGKIEKKSSGTRRVTLNFM